MGLNWIFSLYDVCKSSWSKSLNIRHDIIRCKSSLILHTLAGLEHCPFLFNTPKIKTCLQWVCMDFLASRKLMPDDNPTQSIKQQKSNRIWHRFWFYGDAFAKRVRKHPDVIAKVFRLVCADDPPINIAVALAVETIHRDIGQVKFKPGWCANGIYFKLTIQPFFVGLVYCVDIKGGSARPNIDAAIWPEIHRTYPYWPPSFILKRYMG